MSPLLIALMSASAVNPTMVQYVDGDNMGTTLLQFPAPFAAGNAVIFACYSDGSPLTVTDDASTSYPALTSLLGPQVQLYVQMFGKVAIGGERPVFTITHSGTMMYIGCVAAEFSGVADPLTVVGLAESFETPSVIGMPGVPVTSQPVTVPPNSLMLANFCINAGRVSDFDGGSMVGEPIQLSRAFVDLVAYQVSPGGGTYTFTATVTNTALVQVLALLGVQPDAGLAIDAGVDGGVDAGVDEGIDAGFAIDAGADAGAVFDAGFDAGPPVDAGVDAGFSSDAAVDAGTVFDAGYDAGTLPDAGETDASIDAGVTVDAGISDAGTLMTSDAGTPSVDAGITDGGVDEGPITVGCDCTSVPWFDALAAAALVLLARRRRH